MRRHEALVAAALALFQGALAYQMDPDAGRWTRLPPLHAHDGERATSCAAVLLLGLLACGPMARLRPLVLGGVTALFLVELTYVFLRRYATAFHPPLLMLLAASLAGVALLTVASLMRPAAACTPVAPAEPPPAGRVFPLWYVLLRAFHRRLRGTHRPPEASDRT